MRGFAFLFVFFIVFTSIRAQTFVTSKEVDKSTKSIFDEGRKLAMKQSFGAAKDRYRAALDREPTFQDAMMELAGIYYTQKNMDSSIYYLNLIKSVNPNPSARVYFTLATIYYNQENFAKAIPELESYLKSDIKNPKSVEDAHVKLANSKFALEAMKHPRNFNPQPISGNINTGAPEYLPSISADGELLIFSRMVDRQEDLYFSEYQNQEWSLALPLDAINTENYNEAGHCISADGKTIVFTGCNRPDGMGSCDLYISYFQQGEWSVPVNLGSPVNTPGWESQPSLSADGRTLYFASDRPGGYGFKDIWYSEKNDAGKWSVPINIKSPINTLKNDGSPFIHPDNRTLYFMSDGLPGMGGTDLYVSRRQEDDSWGDPVNLGYPINTTGNDGAMVVNTFGNKAYYTTVKPHSMISSDGMQDTDIYWFDLDRDIRPLSVSYFKAFVLDSISKKPLKGDVQVTDIHTGKLYYKGLTADDGSTLVCLPTSNLYGIQINTPGYLFVSEAINLPDSGDVDKPYISTYLMNKISQSKGRPIVLKNIYFESGSASLSAISDVELNILSQLMKSNPSVIVQINGHTDDVGTEQSNILLSQQRADAVVKRLIQLGVPAKSLLAKGYGESRPVSANNSEAGRQSNRRIEFEVK